MTISIFDINQDIQAIKCLQKVRNSIGTSFAQLVFDPTLYSTKNEDFKTDDFELSNEELEQYAKLASKLR